MGSALSYCQELKELVKDLKNAISKNDAESFGGCIESCRLILDDIEESFQTLYNDSEYEF